MRRRGWDAIYLGANIPLARLEATLEHAHAQLVVLTAQTLPTAATMLELAELLDEHNIPLMYGGLAFNLNSDLQNVYLVTFSARFAQRSAGTRTASQRTAHCCIGR